MSHSSAKIECADLSKDMFVKCLTYVRCENLLVKKWSMQICYFVALSNWLYDHWHFIVHSHRNDVIVIVQVTPCIHKVTKHRNSRTSSNFGAVVHTVFVIFDLEHLLYFKKLINSRGNVFFVLTMETILWKIAYYLVYKNRQQRIAVHIFIWLFALCVFYFVVNSFFHLNLTFEMLFG